MVRLRAEDHGKLYIQELVNRFFEDAEEKMRLHGVSFLQSIIFANERIRW